MKLIFQSVIGSVFLHILYFGGMLVVGFIQTKLYTPDIEGAWESVDTLQNEVVFGMNVSPFFFLVTFIVGTVFCGVVLFSLRKLRKGRGTNS